MKKKSWIILSILFLMIVSVGIYYYCEYITTSTEYYRLTYTPPMEEDGYFGTETTKPKFEIERLGSYPNDSLCVSIITKERRTQLKGYMKLLEKNSKKQCNSTQSQLMHEAEMSALKELINQQFIILRFTHRAGYDTDDLFKFIKSCNNDYAKMKRYCEDNKISFAYYIIG